MKIERLTQNKIKVTLSKDDLSYWNIDIEHLSYNSSKAQEMFWNMMKIAEMETGFDAYNSQLIIEAAQNQNEGFTIIITKIDDKLDYDNIQRLVKGKFKKSELKAKIKQKVAYTSPIIYSFNSFDDLCLCVKEISFIGDYASTLYSYNNTYYLLFENSYDDNLEFVLKEFGNKINFSAFEGILNEYAKIIIKDDAIQILSKHF